MPAAKQWFEQDWFWQAWQPVMFGPRRMAAVPEEVDGIVDLLGPKPGARVLDLCCGIGRHSVELARRGFRVTGVDRTALYLKQAKAAARRAKVEIEFVRRDARRFVRPEAFDAAINMFTSFGFFADPADDERLVSNVWRSLKPGGGLVMEMGGKEWLASIYRERDWHEQNGAFILEERKVQPGWSGVDNRWIVFRGGRKREIRFSLRLYSGVELADLLRKVGFRTVETFGSLAGAPYDNKAQRLIAVARK